MRVEGSRSDVPLADICQQHDRDMRCCQLGTTVAVLVGFDGDKNILHMTGQSGEEPFR